MSRNLFRYGIAVRAYLPSLVPTPLGRFPAIPASLRVSGAVAEPGLRRQQEVTPALQQPETCLDILARDKPFLYTLSAHI